MSDRQEIYFFFKTVLYARSQEQFIKNDEKLKSSKKKYCNILEYYEKLCQPKEYWATCFRSGLAIEGN